MRYNPIALTPFFSLVTHHAARNHRVSGKRLSEKSSLPSAPLGHDRTRIPICHCGRATPAMRFILCSDHNKIPLANEAGTNTPNRPPRSKSGPPHLADLADNPSRTETLQVLVTCVK